MDLGSESILTILLYIIHFTECVFYWQVLTEIFHGTHKPRITLTIMYAILTYISVISLRMPLTPEIR